MQSYEYKIKDPVGIHARPAGMLVKETSKFECDINITFGGKTVNAKGILGLMQLGAKCGDTLIFEFNGNDEEAAKSAISTFIEGAL